MAVIGEMMDLIAHQWKQPLSIISSTISNLPISYELELLDENLINITTTKVLNQVSHLNTTLNEFRGFFRPNKLKSPFKVKNSIESIIKLIYDDLERNAIDIKINSDENIEAYGFENEFKHVILNLVNNSKDAFNERNIQNRTIKLDIYYDISKVIVEVIDSAGGVTNDILPHIFEPNFTTKQREKGSGMGLYMSKMIIDNMDGEISAENIDSVGVKFIMKLSRLN
jgi:C4-dicarboxylate-specific signal transduction histidine kinase